MEGFSSNLNDTFTSTRGCAEPMFFPQHILPLLPLYSAQWWGYESLTAIALVISDSILWKIRFTTKLTWFDIPFISLMKLICKMVYNSKNDNAIKRWCIGFRVPAFSSRHCCFSPHLFKKRQTIITRINIAAGYTHAYYVYFGVQGLRPKIYTFWLFITEVQRWHDFSYLVPSIY